MVMDAADGSHVARQEHKKWPVFPAILKIGGAEGDRTLDLRIANATLSQLSYRPRGWLV